MVSPPYSSSNVPQSGAIPSREAATDAATVPLKASVAVIAIEGTSPRAWNIHRAKGQRWGQQIKVISDRRTYLDAFHEPILRVPERIEVCNLVKREPQSLGYTYSEMGLTNRKIALHQPCAGMAASPYRYG